MAEKFGRANLNDIARDAGVSRSTVSLVMQESPLVAEATRLKVKESAQKLGYIYNRAAASLRSQSTGPIGVIISSVGNPFFAEVSLGLDQVFGENGKTVILGQHSDNLAAQERLITSMLESRISGLILVPANGSEMKHMNLLIRANFPTIFLSRYVAGVKFPYVGGDIAPGVCRATNHLIEHGKTEFVLIGGSEKSSSKIERVEGMKRALTENKIALTHLTTVGDEATRKCGYESAQILMKRGLRNVGIIAYNDIVASGALAAFHDYGINVGTDVALISIDNVEFAAYSNPSLTSLDMTPTGMGVAASQTLLSVIQNPEVNLKNVILDNELILRESCGCQEKRGESI
jgi:LacI family transcriptional regulator